MLYQPPYLHDLTLPKYFLFPTEICPERSEFQFMMETQDAVITELHSILGGIEELY